MVREQETHYRALYATKPFASELRDAKALLSNVFGNRELYQYQAEEPHEVCDPPTLVLILLLS